MNLDRGTMLTQIGVSAFSLRTIHSRKCCCQEVLYTLTVHKLFDIVPGEASCLVPTSAITTMATTNNWEKTLKRKVAPISSKKLLKKHSYICGLSAAVGNPLYLKDLIILWDSRVGAAHPPRKGGGTDVDVVIVGYHAQHTPVSAEQHLDLGKLPWSTSPTSRAKGETAQGSANYTNMWQKARQQTEGS